MRFIPPPALGALIALLSKRDQAAPPRFDRACNRLSSRRTAHPSGKPIEIIDAMDGAGVARALNAQVPWYGEDNRYHHESAARFPGPFALLGVIDPASAGAPERLERMAREEGAGGFRIHFNEPGRRDHVL